MASSERAAAHVRRVRATLAGLGLVGPLALSACQQLIGLDAYEKVPCENDDCARADAGELDAGPLPRDASNDVRVDAPPGADPVSWARWPMPSWKDASSGNPPDFDDVQAELARERVTGLVWRREEGPVVKLPDARAYCAGLPNGPWRLPKRIELVTLLDFGRAGDRRIDPLFQASNAAYWTSSEVRPFTGGPEQRYWTVSFESGALGQGSGSRDSFAVRCVRAAR